MNAPKSFSLITILFLLFGLGELAQAMYNPATGSFLSRDPIEERGGENLYGFVRNDGISKWDGNGHSASGQNLKNNPNIIVALVASKPGGKCGSYDVYFRITLDRDAPEDGYVIQYIDNTTTVENCAGVAGPPWIRAEKYYEAFEVKKGSRVIDGTKELQYDDNWAGIQHACSKGSDVTNGLLKYITKRTTKDLGGLGRSGIWKTGNEGGHHWSKNLPSSLNPPDGWGDVGLGTSHKMIQSWDCCSNTISRLTKIDYPAP